MPNPKGGTPPKEYQFKPGKSGNPGGKTREQRRAEVEAGEVAAKIQKQMLDALAEHVATDPTAALDAIKADPLKLIKDALDRANGTPVQTVDNKSSDGSMTPRGPNLTKLSDEELAQLERLTDKARDPKGMGEA